MFMDDGIVHKINEHDLTLSTCVGPTIRGEDNCVIG